MSGCEFAPTIIASLANMDQNEFEQRLNEAIEKTTATIAEYRELTRPEAPDVAIGRVSRMDAINNRSVVEAALRKAEEKLKNLERVKESIGTSEFGKCKKCGQDIPVGRLLIRPESLLCLRCAS